MDLEGADGLCGNAQTASGRRANASVDRLHLCSAAHLQMPGRLPTLGMSSAQSDLRESSPGETRDELSDACRTRPKKRIRPDAA
jgi:hypothetical protein